MNGKKRTEIADLGEFGLIERLTQKFTPNHKQTLLGVGDDAAVIGRAADDRVTLLSTDMLIEGVNFDLVYFPLRHLGYKAVVVGISDILAMNGIAEQITVSVGVSGKISVEQLDELYEGVGAACRDYRLDLVGGDTSASINGLIISVTALGSARKNEVAYRSGARENDLICITGDVGAAYMGLHLLEREKRAFEGHTDPSPDFAGHEYILRRQLKPSARLDVIEGLREAELVPTSMIDLSDGLASDLLQVCRASNRGARIYLDRLPIATETYAMAEELGIDPVVAALNGGDDHELLLTIPLEHKDRIIAVGGLEIIGHVTGPNTGAELVLPDGENVPLTAPGIR